MSHEQLNKEILKQALSYAALKLQVLVLYGIQNGICTCKKGVACESPGKHPATINGLSEATLEDASIEAWFSHPEPRNIGIRTGKESDVFVIDIDGPRGEESLSSYFGLLPPTQETVTGRGRHLFYKYPGQFVKSFADILGKGSKVDCRGDGGYVVAPPSTHISGKRYESILRPIVEAPKVLLDVVCRKDREVSNSFRQNSKRKNQDMSDDDIRFMLSHLDPDMGYDDWLKVGMALHSGGYSVELWDEWSKGGQKYAGDCLYKWGTFSEGA